VKKIKTNTEENFIASLKFDISSSAQICY